MVDSLGTIKSGIGLGSGLDIEALVNSLIAAQGKPKAEKLDDRELTTQAKITAYGNVKSALATFKDQVAILKDTTKLQGRAASVINDPATANPEASFFTATASSYSAVSSYKVEVESLAEAHKLASPYFQTEGTVIGTGTIRLKVKPDPGQPDVTQSFDIVIGDSSKTLAGIRDAINDRSDTTGVTATIVEADAGKRLVLTTNEPGTDNRLNVEIVSDGDGDDSDNSGLSQLTYIDGGSQNLTEITAASDARIRLDGTAAGNGELITSSTNTIVGKIEGLTLELKKADPGFLHTLNVNKDTSGSRQKIEDFVNAYNDVMDILNDVTKVNEDTTVARGQALGGGDLLGDSTIRIIERTLQTGISQLVRNPGGIESLSQMGILSDKETGKLTINSEKLDSSLTSHFDSVGKLFGADFYDDGVDGVGTYLYKQLDSYLSFDGLVTLETTSLNDEIGRIQRERIELNETLADLEVELTLKFSTLDALLGKFQLESSRLVQQLSDFVEPQSFRK